VEYAYVLAWTLAWAVPGVSVLITGVVLLAKHRHRLPARTVRLGQAGFLVLGVTALVGVALQVATVYLWTMDDAAPDRVAAVSFANTVSGLALTLGNVVGMALLVAALVTRSTPVPAEAPGAGYGA
jgi:hypothetical protein